MSNRTQWVKDEDIYNRPAPKKYWTTRKIVAWIVVAVLGLTSLGLIINTQIDRHNTPTPTSTYSTTQPVPKADTPDSGVEACKDAASTITTNHKLGKYAPQTDADLAAAVKPWSDSKYSDLQTAGTNATNAILVTNKTVNDDNASFGDAMAANIRANAAWAALQEACGKHGVQLPRIPSNSNA